MQRFAAVGLFLILILAIGLSGCGGGSTSTTVTTTPTSVTLSPSPISMEKGGVLQVQIIAKDSKGNPLFGDTPTFASSNTAAVTVSNAGLLCAGTWDSLTTPVVCTPAAAAGTSNLTATVSGVTSNVVVASVHDHVDNIAVAPALVDCKSQNATQIFTATAFSGGVDITSTVGAFTWTLTDGTVATVTNSGPSTTPALTATQSLVTAKNSGQTNVVANVSGTNSVPAVLITCSPATISVHVQNVPDTSFTIATAATKQLVADVVDTQGVTITGLNLTWNSSQPAIAGVSSAGLVTGVAPGTSVITASCTPTTCNPGLNQAVSSNNIYSNPVVGTITGTASPSSVYVTTTTAPASGGHSDLIPISTSTNTVGTAIALPTDAAINSLAVAANGSKAYLGSSKGLIVVDATTNTLSSSVTNVLGKVLAIAPSGQFVVTSDTGAGKVYIFDSSNNTVTTFNIAGATHAAFTTDSLKAYIVAGSTLYQYSILFALKTIPMNAVANDVVVNRTGQFAYTAGGEAASVVDRATCINDSIWAPAAGDIVGTGASPDLIVSASTGDLLAVEGASSEVDKITPAIGAPAAGTSCPPTLTSNTLTSANFGVGAFTPRQLLVTSDGSKAFVTSNLASILMVDVAGVTTAAIPLAGGGTQSFTGGLTLDGKNLYVGVGGVNAVHRIDTTAAPASADVLQIPVSFIPDLVAVRPH
jgi:hypothetical protein